MSRDERVHLIAGPTGQIEISVNHHPDDRYCAIVCHPHPQHGGTMNNKVVTTLAKGYQLTHFTTIRFNYRGVGQSAGEYAEGLGETDDLLAVIAWAKQHFQQLPLHLAGFSFGTFVTLNAIQQLPEPSVVKSVILVAPPIARFKYDIKTYPKPWLVFQCDDDEVVSAQDVYEWIDAMIEDHKPELVRFQQAGHFFHGRLVELRSQQVEWLQKHVTT